MRVGMIGLGKLGKPVAVAIAAKGHSVMGYDVVPELMSKNFTAIEAGPNKEPNGFQEMLAKSDIKFGSMQEVVDHSDIIFLAIQTPHGKEYEGVTRVPDTVANFDYSYLVDCIKKLNSCQIDKPKVVAIISTVLPFTIRRHVLPEITNSNIKVVYNPFFIAMGTVVWDFYHPEFVLIGKYDDWACQKLKELYDTIYSYKEGPVKGNPIRFAEMSIESAELTKVSYNTFITMKIDYVNYLMEICEQIPNANVDDVTNALKMATERLISTKYLTAGMGDGGCLDETQKIYTENGLVNINTINVGDKVLGGDGLLHKVTNLFSRDFSGDLIRFDLMGNKNITLTPNHKVYSKYSINGPKEKTKLSEMCQVPSEQLFGLDKSFYYIAFPNIKEQTLPAPELSWNIQDLLSLAGYYLAEGCIKGTRGHIDGVQFTLNSKEVEYMNDIENIIKRMYDDAYITRKVKKSHNTATDICFYKAKLAQYIKAEFGSGAKNKKIPMWVLYGPTEYAKLILQGLFRGDGHCNYKGFTYTTISKELMIAVQFLLNKLNIRSYMRVQNNIGKKYPNPVYQVNIRNYEDAVKLTKIVNFVNKKEIQKKIRPLARIPIDENYTYYKIMKTTKIPFSGKVYNIEVEDVNNYVTQGGLVCNSCHPRDNIAMSWLAKELNMDYDFCRYLMLVREAQVDKLADAIENFTKKVSTKDMPIVILGKSFKANIGLTTGSPAMLLSNLLLERNINHVIYDPLVTPEYKLTVHTPHVFFIATQHEIWKEFKFPSGSVVIDPFRYYKDFVPSDCRYYLIGIGAKT